MDILKDLPQFITMAHSIVKTILSERNQTRMSQIKAKGSEMFENTEDFMEAMLDDAHECSKLIVEIFSDALSASGYDVPESRAIVRSDIRQHFEKELNKRLTIIPYSNKS